jgi:hypothetical protein
MSVIPEGWSVDPEDTSVGIFGNTGVHEACPADYEQGVEWLEDNGDVAGPYLMVKNTFYCLDCKQSATFVTQEWLGED